MDTALRNALRKYNGLRQQLDNVLLGDDGDLWEAELRKFVAKRACWVSPPILLIDRTKPFNPAEFMHCEAVINEEDQRSLAFTGIDLELVSFKLMLDEKDDDDKVYIGTYIRGGTKLERLKATKNIICLDAKILEILYENQDLIPERWKKRTNGKTTYIYFDGTVIVLLDGERCTLGLYWDVNFSRWKWCRGPLNQDRYANDPSVVLQSNRF